MSMTKDKASRRHCDLLVTIIVDRLIAPRAKLGFVWAVDQETAISSLGSVLRLGKVTEREAGRAPEPARERHARQPLQDGVLVLYDVRSSYFEGPCCPLARYGYSRDHRRDRPQIVYRLLYPREGPHHPTEHTR